MSTATSGTEPAPKPAARARARPPRPRLTLAEAMGELERAGSEQTRRTYARHGVAEPMFGVSFATLKALVKRIGVDHALAGALWDTGNYDARNLAVKIADPAAFAPADLDRWAADVARQGHPASGMSRNYVAMLTVEGPHAAAKAAQWIGAADPDERATGWSLLRQLALRDASLPDAWFAAHLADIERTLLDAPNHERDGMHRALIAIGCRSAALRDAALAAAARIGPVHVDYGDTSCETPDAAVHIAKAWAHATAKGFTSPAAQERTRASPRTRC